MLVDERSAATDGPLAPSGVAVWRALAAHPALVTVGACVALAALTLLAPSTPTYDPWAWIIWGREVTHLDLVTSDGPSWKPLPVLFTTVFSLFGAAAPALWLVVARAGALLGVVMAFRLARRLGGGVAGGVMAAGALAIAPWWFRNAALGNSEGLIVACLLGAIDRELAGDRRAAFALAVGAGLLRPEAWPFLGLYGAWLLWRRELPVAVVVGAGLAVIALWILPEAWGSGDPWRAAHRAKTDITSSAPTYADHPALELLKLAGTMLTGPLLAGLAAALGVGVVRRDRRLLVLAALAVAWLGIVAYMTQDGFSGNVRYLIAPVALLIVLAGAGAGQVLRLAADRLAARRGAVPGSAAVSAVVVAGLAFAAPSFARLAPTLRDLGYQADMTNSLGGLIDDAGGAAALNRCGHAFTGPFLVPQVAWQLGLHVDDVDLFPERPGVVFRVKVVPSSAGSPSLDGLGPTRTLAFNRSWRILTACGATE